MKRRAEIDGLRGLALTLVVIFHVFPSVLPGGFVGVDIFFVLAGFLTAEGVQRRLAMDDGGPFPFVDFYSSRVRRLFPVLLVVLAVHFAAAPYVYSANTVRVTVYASVSALFGVGNLYAVWGDNGSYFDNVSDPLRHLWSLSTEVQFYLLCPLLLYRFRRTRPTRLAAICMIYALFAFCFAHLLPGVPAARFYFHPLPRLAEMAVGVAAFLLVAPLQPLIQSLSPARLAQCFSVSVLGWSLSAAVFSAGGHHPGPITLLPTLSTALFLMVGNHLPPHLMAVCAWRPLTQWGRASYTVYLVHFPLCAMLDIFGVPRSFLVAYALLCYILALSLPIYLLVERPINRMALSRMATRRFAGVCLGLSMLLTVWMVGSIGMGTRLAAVHSNATFPEITRCGWDDAGDDLCPLWEVPDMMLDIPIAATPARPSPACPTVSILRRVMDDTPPIVRSRPPAPSPARAVLLAGDSFAAMFQPMLEEMAIALDSAFFSLASTSCPPDTGYYEKPAATAQDEWEMWLEMHRILRQVLPQLDMLILAHFWDGYEWGALAAGLDRVLAEARRHNVPVLVVGSTPARKTAIDMCPVVIADLHQLMVDPIRHHCVDPLPIAQWHAWSFQRRLVATVSRYEGVSVWDPTPLLCGGGPCRAYTPWGMRLYADQWHLSCEGSRVLGRMAIRQTAVPLALASALLQGDPLLDDGIMQVEMDPALAQ